MPTWGGSTSWAGGQKAKSADINTFIIQNLLAIYPVGAYVYVHQAPTAVETKLNNKWLECNGVAVSRTTYSGLWDLFRNGGTTSPYGNGDGSTTFNLPDLRGRMLVSVSATGGHADVTAFGGSDGAALATRRPAHAHTFANASHGHTWSGTSSAAGDHSHPAIVPATATGSGGGSTGDNTLSDSIPQTSAAGNHTENYTPTIVANTSLQLVGASAAHISDSPGYLVGGVWMIAYA